MRADGKNLSLTFDGVEVNCVSTSIVLEAEKADADLVTFSDVTGGLDWQWFFTVTGFPDYSQGTWWSYLWTQYPFTPIPFVFKPYGNAVASTVEPWFVGNVTIDRKPPVGGDAGAVWQFDTRLTCTAAPTRKTA